MKRKHLILISVMLASSLAIGGLAVGITYASYTSSKTYNFNSENTAVTIRDVKHYFDPTSGNGATSGTAFVISSPAHLRNLAKLTNLGVFGNTSYYFSLANSFNWSGEAMEPIGKDSTTPFHGFFKGNNHTIQGLVVNATGAYAGMFGYVNTSSAGAVENLVLSGPTINCVPTSATNVKAGFVAGSVNGSSSSGHVRGVIVYGGNENSKDSSSNELIKRAKITANSYATVTSSAATKSLIVGETNSSGYLGVMTFVAQMGDIDYSLNPLNKKSTINSSSQSSLAITSGVANFTYSYYRNTGQTGTVVKVSS